MAEGGSRPTTGDQRRGCPGWTPLGSTVQDLSRPTPTRPGPDEVGLGRNHLTRGADCAQMAAPPGAACVQSPGASRGRGFELGPGLGTVLAFNVADETIEGALVTASGHAVCHRRISTRPDQLHRQPDDFYRQLADMSGAVLSDAFNRPDLLVNGPRGSTGLPLIGAAMAWPAALDRQGFIAERALGTAWRASTAREHLSRALGFPLERCHAIEIANAGAMTVAMECDTTNQWGSVLAVYVGSRISLGTFLLPHPRDHRLPFIDGVLIGGRRGIAGDIGHVALAPEIIRSINASFSPHDDLPRVETEAVCVCGSRRHLQALFGLPAITARLDLANCAGSDAVLSALREAV